jgi:hypothetical protein
MLSHLAVGFGGSDFSRIYARVPKNVACYARVPKNVARVGYKLNNVVDIFGYLGITF